MKLNDTQLKAVDDAIVAILKSRMPAPPAGSDGGVAGPVTIEIDPNLKNPKDKGNAPQGPTPPTEIFDPKGLLQKSKDNQLKKQQQSSNTTYHGPDDPANKPEQGNSNGGGGEKGPEKPEQKGEQQGSQSGQGQGQQGQEGQSGQNSQEGQAGSSSSSGSSESQNSAQNSASDAQEAANTAKQAASAAQDLVNKLNQGGSGGEKAQQKADQAAKAAKEAQQAANKAQEAANNGNTKAAEKAAKEAAEAAKKATDAAKQAGEQSVYDANQNFKDGWNGTMAKFDNDSASDEDIQKALEEAKNNKSLDPAKKKGITDALAAIKDSRIRPFEIDQETADGFKKDGLTLPKNTQIKADDLGNTETEKEKAARVERIKKSLEGEGAKQTLAQIETDSEMKTLAELDKKAEEERAKEAAAKIRQPANFENFADDLLNAVYQQTEEEEGDVSARTYFRPNPLSELTGLAIPGEYYPDVPSKPLIVMFIDQSGSWDEDDIERGKQAIKSIYQYKEEDKIDIIFRYFADHVHNEPDPYGRRWGERATCAFPEILQEIKKLNAENVIIMTDHDFDRPRFTDWSRCKKIVVEGCVWWLWRGTKCEKAVQYLEGYSGTFEYWLN